MRRSNALAELTRVGRVAREASAARRALAVVRDVTVALADVLLEVAEIEARRQALCRRQVCRQMTRAGG